MQSMQRRQQSTNSEFTIPGCLDIEAEEKPGQFHNRGHANGRRAREESGAIYVSLSHYSGVSVT